VKVQWAPAAEVERTLLQAALAGTASHRETVVRALRRRTADPGKAQTARSLSWTWAEDGSLALRGRLAPAEGAALVAAIEALVPATAARPRPGDLPAEWQQRAVEHAPGAAVDRVSARRADLDNLVLACPFHHQLIHDQGYRIRWTGDRWQTLRPDGSEIPEAGGPLAGDLDELVSYAARNGRLITDRSLSPTWYGERLDPEPILDTLLPRRTAATAAA
jgi:hypothetical protein